MSFCFLHAADLHLNSPFVGLGMKDDGIAKRFAAATREAFSDLITKAIDAKVAFVVIAGDVYDGEWKDMSIGLFFNREVGRLDRAGIPLYLAKGNHDAESVVTKAITPLTNVSVFPTAKAATFRMQELKVALHGRSFPERAVVENYALTYPEPVPGWLNIGVLHTSCDGRPEHSNYAPCTVQDMVNRGYDYWALGHVHEYEVLSRDPWIVFPGNMQGRSVRECGPKGAVIVEVTDGRVANVRRLIVDRARWAAVSVNVRDVGEETALLQRIREAIHPAINEAKGKLLALRVRLEGHTRLDPHLRSDLRHFTDETQAAAYGLYEDVWLESLLVETEAVYSPPLGHGDPMASLDLNSIIGELVHDPGFRARATDLLLSVSSKTPAGIISGDENLDRLLTDASAVILARTINHEKAAIPCA